MILTRFGKPAGLLLALVALCALAIPAAAGAKKKNKADVYVRLDRSTMAVSRYPRMGYGDTTQPPYVWPLSNPEPASKEKVAYVVTPPPLPKSVSQLAKVSCFRR